MDFEGVKAGDSVGDRREKGAGTSRISIRVRFSFWEGKKEVKSAAIGGEGRAGMEVRRGSS